MFVIYHKESTALIRTKLGQIVKTTCFSTERSAKGWLTKMFNNGKLDKYAKEDFAITDASNYHDNIEKMVTRRNMMSGKEYQESINTPCFLSPSCNSYWSM